MKILIIGMADSIHLAKWLSQYSDSNFLFQIVSSSPHRRIHPTLRGLLRKPNFKMGRFSRALSLFLWILDRVLSNFLRGLIVAFTIRSFKPDIVHVLEFQNAGYVFLRSRRFIGNASKFKLVLTPYGSDIFWFQHYPKHLRKIRKLLSIADGISCECRRDELLAIEHGFKGILLPRIPAFGSTELPELDPDRTKRRIIAVKGYQNKWGQATLALQAISSVADDLVGFNVEIFSAEGKAVRSARKLEKHTGIQVKIHKKHSMSNQDVLELFSRSQVYIGLSKSDGISASMIEAMAQGAIPIQSNSSCCDEWLDDEIGGFLVDYQDVEKVANLILRIVSDEEFQISAARHNQSLLRKKIAAPLTKKAALDTYNLLN